MFLSKYAVARHIYIPIPKAGSASHAVGADWTPAAGDVKICIDGAAAANVTNLPTAIAMGNSAVWDFSLTLGEITGKQIIVTVADSATKAVDDTGFEIETYGNASAQHAFDLGTASTAQTGDNFARLGAPAGASHAADTAAVKAQTAAIEVDTGTDIPALLTTIDDFLDTEIAAILAKTNLIPGTIDGKTFAQLVTLMAAVLLGKASGLATTTAVYRAVDDSKDRVTATVDADGNRTALTLDAS